MPLGDVTRKAPPPTARRDGIPPVSIYGKCRTARLNRLNAQRHRGRPRTRGSCAETHTEPRRRRHKPPGSATRRGPAAPGGSPAPPAGRQDRDPAFVLDMLERAHRTYAIRNATARDRPPTSPAAPPRRPRRTRARLVGLDLGREASSSGNAEPSSWDALRMRSRSASSKPSSSPPPASYTGRIASSTCSDGVHAADVGAAAADRRGLASRPAIPRASRSRLLLVALHLGSSRLGCRSAYPIARRSSRRLEH